MIFTLIQTNTVFYKEIKAYCLCHPLFTRERSKRITQFSSTILVYNEISLTRMSISTIFARCSIVTKHLTLIQKQTIGMVKSPTQTYIHSTDNVFTKCFFSVCGLFRHLHDAPVRLIGIVYVVRNIFKRRHNRNIFIIGINFNNMDNLASVALITIDHNFRFNRSGSKIVIVFLNNIVVIAATETKIQIIFCSHNRQRQYRYNHQQSQCHCKNFLHCNIPP